ncbi:four helix bundle protein [Chitinispirillales bacterium ANBcel5]|uniref:four helix bundle protein n=1 Tax=Cellulosispirillum alkaliphilum TaxID=3039283 RepID=UPI002A568D61|nr:four helix bundle protein [Chitinispirillales bacterium ANBcel5]
MQQLEQERQYVIGRQILKSGTSIGANVEEAIGGQSRQDFFAKITIAYKEARETKYWLRLLKEGNLLQPNIADSLLNDCDELLRILTAIQKTTKCS